MQQSRHGHLLTDRGLELLEAVDALKRDMLDHVIQVERDVKAGRIPLESMVDVCYALKKSADAADDIRKECNKQLEFAGKVACMLWVQRSLNDPEGSDRLDGHVATGTPKESQVAELPQRGTPEYERLATYFGLTPQQIADDYLRPHWPHVQECVNALVQQGRRLPPGIDTGTLRPKYALTNLRLKKGVTNGERNHG